MDRTWWYDNPEFLRHARTGLALPRALWILCIYQVVLLAVAGANLAVYVYARGKYSSPAECAQWIFVQLLGLDFLVLALSGATRIANAVGSEHFNLTLDAQRLAPLDPRAFAIGKLIGVPIRGWLHVAASLPLATLCVAFGGVSLGVMAQCFLLLGAGTLFYHSVALLRFRAPKATDVSGGAAVVVIFLATIGFAFPPGGHSSVLSLLSVAPLVRQLIQFGEARITLFGSDLPAVPFAVPVLLAAAWLTCTAAARTLRYPSRPVWSKPEALLLWAAAAGTAALIALPPTGPAGLALALGHVEGLAAGLLLLGLVFAQTVAMDSYDLNVGARVAARAGRDLGRMDERASAVPIVLAVAVASAAIVFGFGTVAQLGHAGPLDPGWPAACAAGVACGIASQGMFVLWARLVSRTSGRGVGVGIGFALWVGAAVGQVGFSALKLPHVALACSWLNPYLYYTRGERSFWDGLAASVVQLVLALAATQAYRARERGLVAAAWRTLRRAGELAGAPVLALIAGGIVGALAAGTVGAEPQTTGVDVRSGLHVYRVEFWCTQPGWEAGGAVGPERRGMQEPVYRRFLAWDTADRGIHPEAYDVAIYVANDTGKPIENVTLTMRERRLAGPVFRRESGEFVGLIDRGASVAAAEWIEAPGATVWNHVIQRIEPGARKKILFHGVSLGAAPAQARAARPFCWKVEYAAELRAGDPGAAPISRGIGVLDLALED